MQNDSVNHPSHYTDGKIEVIDFIEDKKLNFHRGNAVKYIARAGKKNPEKEVEDLKKAAWYINREIERLKNEDCEEFLKNFEEEKNNEQNRRTYMKTNQELMNEIKEQCGDCKAWSGTDCTRNPYTQGCLKDELKQYKVQAVNKFDE